MTHYADSHPVARKAHICDMCSRAIDPGETYRRSAGMDGSSAWTWRECAHCEAFARLAHCRSWQDDGYGPDLFAEFEPATVAEARVRAQWRRKWRRLDGSLYPVPALTITEDKYGFGWPTAIAPGGAA